MLPAFNKHPVLTAVAFFLLLAAGCSSISHQAFSNPDEAVNTFVSALRAEDKDQVSHILGPAGDELLMSGDPVEIRDSVKKFLAAYDVSHNLISNDDGTLTLVVGDDDWPLPIPLARNAKDGTWYFDTAAGKDEIINRRIGRNELDTIQTMLAISDAQREYARTDPDNDGVPAYAQKFISDPGRKNGLYWPTDEGQPESPLGALIATAASQGYTKSSNSEPQPYRGYFYRMLKSQGPNAPGGARDYMVNGQMLAGFGAVAYPAVYGNSGVMTFIVNQDGDVYQRDLGADTAKIVSQISSFDPDAGWTKVPDPATPTPSAATTETAGN